MTITEDKQRYFIKTVTTYDKSLVTPLQDFHSYGPQLKKALDVVGKGSPAQSAKQFIYISNWWLGLLSGKWKPAPLFSPIGPTVDDTDCFYLDSSLYKLWPLAKILKEKAKKGVDVRVMGWVSGPVMGGDSDALLSSWNFGTIVARAISKSNSITMNSIKDLRASAIGNKAILNILAHSAGSVHVKLVVIGDGKAVVGFTGGLDFQKDRWGFVGHPGYWNWHDMQAEVRGKAALALYNIFMNIWNENVRRKPQVFRFEEEGMPSHFDGKATQGKTKFKKTPEVPPLKLVSPWSGPLSVASSKAKHHVQSLQTVPMHKYKKGNMTPEGKPVTYAKKGLFEILDALKTAISAAQKYIYIEDQSFWSKEVMSWINARVKKSSKVKVILVTGGASDPNDDPLPVEEILYESINEGLLKGLSPTVIKNQIRMFRLWGDTLVRLKGKITKVTSINAATCKVTVLVSSGAGNVPMPANTMRTVYANLKDIAFFFYRVVDNEKYQPGKPLLLTVKKAPGGIMPTVGKVEIHTTHGVIVHSKTTLIDDKWALIGSCNVTRRSLYTDFEHAVAFIDEKGKDVREYRKYLWAEHFQGEGQASLTAETVKPFHYLKRALRGWEPSWKIASNSKYPKQPLRAATDPGPPYIELVKLPLSFAKKMSSYTRKKYDTWLDPKSTDLW